MASTGSSMVTPDGRNPAGILRPGRLDARTPLWNAAISGEIRVVIHGPGSVCAPVRKSGSVGQEHPTAEGAEELQPRPAPDGAQSPRLDPSEKNLGEPPLGTSRAAFTPKIHGWIWRAVPERPRDPNAVPLRTLRPLR